MTTTMARTSSGTGTDCGTRLTFDCITQPGCYVDDATGHLVRVSTDFEPAAFATWFTWQGESPAWWTCVSNDPNCSTDECRKNAANCGISYDF